jgi:putative Holliday junction resolvase
VNIRGRLLAIDYGEKNIGLAYSDALAVTVQPLPSIGNTGLKDLKRKLKSLAEELEITALVVGLPLNMDGSSNDSVKRIEKLMHQLESAIKVPVAAVDERLSTVEAEEYWGRMNARQRKKYKTIDSLAAALILERFLKEP